ncbi:MAG: isoprenylcysteine carboxylmethyltransferase family protein [archaeon]|nr:isoprenylcysteine carboxylmethyltransferase family protein [archaeon]MCP8307024.1 isoprenylcysteine carboxylmethyltransferase family protein [archaeon]
MLFFKETVCPIEWTKKEYSKKQKIIAYIPAGVFFLILIPFILVKVLPSLDLSLGLPKFILAPFNLIMAPFFLILGFLFSAWSVFVQFRIGKGTPIPAIPPKKLIIKGPYAYCRNPMGLGIFVFYLGFGILTGSLSSIGFTILFMSLLLAYYKFIEEKELEERFGQEYIEYRSYKGEEAASK